MANLRKLVTSVLKEARILLRDRQAMFLFFVMPPLFVLILSLSLQDAFGERTGVAFPMLLVDLDGAQVGSAVFAAFAKNRHFKVERVGPPAPDRQKLERAVMEGRYKFVIIVPPGATEHAESRVVAILSDVSPELLGEPEIRVRLLADPALRLDYRAVVGGELEVVLHGVAMRLAGERLEQNLHAMGYAGALPRDLRDIRLFAPIADEPVGHDRLHTVPSSVQQNAPAWTLLAMFFLTVPLSVSFIKERDQGSLSRLQTMAVPGWVVLGGKVFPFFIINQMQMILILAVSAYVLPLLGGDRLALGNAPLALALLGASASMAAIGFGIAVAMFARTVEQAASFSSATVMIMAALGGVLVPKTVMPLLMQHIAVVSPLSWGVDGFLDIFVRGGGVAEVLPEVAGLLGFSAACHVLAILRYESRP
jgi:ABC-2 type transport system permease protein